MPTKRKKAVEPSEEEILAVKSKTPVEVPEPVKKAVEKAPDAGSITIAVPKDINFAFHKPFTRTFSQEKHGDDFKEVAEAFRKRFNGTVL